MNRQEQIVRTKTLKNKNLVLILSIIFLTVFLFNTINSLIYLLIPFGGIVLIINGIEMLIASSICLIILKKRKHYICPVCGKSRVCYRKLTKTIMGNNKYYNYYIDSYECPNCKKVTEVSITKSKQFENKNIVINSLIDASGSDFKEM